jgi:site-specific DNA recombinase
VRYRYYVTCALAQGRPEAAGSVTRVSASQVEQPVLQALREHRSDFVAVPNRELIEHWVERVVLRPITIEITLRADSGAADRDHVDARDGDFDTTSSAIAAAAVLQIPWSRAATKRQREIILPEQPELSDHRPIRAETRATLVRAIALGRHWLDELITGAVVSPEAVAHREGCSRRHVNMTISLAFLAPDLVRAAVEGRLPRGVGVARLIDPPIEWTRQWQMLGLQPG